MIINVKLVLTKEEFRKLNEIFKGVGVNLTIYLKSCIYGLLDRYERYENEN